MKSNSRIEQELFKANDQKEKLKITYTSSNILINYERIKVLEWVLSDKIDELHSVGD